MNLFAKQNIPPPGSNDILFRISLWGPLISLLIFLVGALVGVALFIYSYQASITWGMVLSGIYNLIMWGICHILFRTVTATLSPANWLTRISSGGILLNRDEEMEAVKLVRLQLGYSISQAKAFIEKNQQQDTPAV